MEPQKISVWAGDNMSLGQPYFTFSFLSVSLPFQMGSLPSIDGDSIFPFEECVFSSNSMHSIHPMHSVQSIQPRICVFINSIKCTQWSQSGIQFIHFIQNILYSQCIELIDFTQFIQCTEFLSAQIAYQMKLLALNNAWYYFPWIICVEWKDGWWSLSWISQMIYNRFLFWVVWE